MTSFLLSLVFMIAVTGGAGRWAQLKQRRLADATPDTEEV
jgi:hypothetical protein